MKRARQEDGNDAMTGDASIRKRLRPGHLIGLGLLQPGEAIALVRGSDANGSSNEQRIDGSIVTKAPTFDEIFQIFLLEVQMLS